MTSTSRGRLTEEARRRTKVIGTIPDERAGRSRVHAVLVDVSIQGRGIRITTAGPGEPNALRAEVEPLAATAKHGGTGATRFTDKPKPNRCIVCPWYVLDVLRGLRYISPLRTGLERPTWIPDPSAAATCAAIRTRSTCPQGWDSRRSLSPLDQTYGEGVFGPACPALAGPTKIKDSVRC